MKGAGALERSILHRGGCPGHEPKGKMCGEIIKIFQIRSHLIGWESVAHQNTAVREGISISVPGAPFALRLGCARRMPTERICPPGSPGLCKAAHLPLRLEITVNSRATQLATAGWA